MNLRQLVLLTLPILLLACAPEVDHFAEGKALFDQENYKQARAPFQRAIEANPADPEAHYYAGRSAAMVADMQAAETHLLKAIELNPEAPAYHDWLGRTYGVIVINGDLADRMRFGPRIRESFERSLELDPSNIEAQSFLATYYMEAPPGGRFLGDIAKAERMARELLESDPATGHQVFAAVLAKQRKYDEAEAELQKLLALNPGDPDGFLALARLHAQRQQFGPAMENFDRALAMQADNQQALFGVGAVAVASGEHTERGIEALTRLTGLERTLQSPALNTAYANLAALYERTGNRETALATYRKAFALNHLLSADHIHRLETELAAGTPQAADAAAAAPQAEPAKESVETPAPAEPIDEANAETQGEAPEDDEEATAEEATDEEAAEEADSEDDAPEAAEAGEPGNG